jgi:hypothetical protein
MYSWNMLGLDTLERITIGEGGGDLPLELREGPKVWHCDLGGNSDKLLYLYPSHLKLLYERFKEANPKGVVSGAGDFFDAYAPPGLAAEKLDKLEEEGKIFVNIFYKDPEHGYPHARKYLPELLEPALIDRMAADPWLNVRLLDKAEKEGRVPKELGEAARWSPEWRAYCDKLLSAGDYK